MLVEMRCRNDDWSTEFEIFIVLRFYERGSWRAKKSQETHISKVSNPWSSVRTLISPRTAFSAKSSRSSSDTVTSYISLVSRHHPLNTRGQHAPHPCSKCSDWQTRMTIEWNSWSWKNPDFCSFLPIFDQKTKGFTPFLFGWFDQNN